MKRRRTVSITALAAAIASVAAIAAMASTAVKPYVVPVGNQYEVDALLSVDDKVPLLGGDPASSTE